jgi:NTP pyrophosphatase (non-canonical NTP hydrolase)
LQEQPIITEEYFLETLIKQIKSFNTERDWDQYHSPKNLAMAFVVEVAEIAEHFQWLTDAQSRDLSKEKMAQVKDEIGDAMILLLNLSDKLGIDPIAAAKEKLKTNAAKYPIEKAKGKADKYTEYEK